jgi:hypothetical protein
VVERLRTFWNPQMPLGEEAEHRFEERRAWLTLDDPELFLDC